MTRIQQAEDTDTGKESKAGDGSTLSTSTAYSRNLCRMRERVVTWKTRRVWHENMINVAYSRINNVDGDACHTATVRRSRWAQIHVGSPSLFVKLLRCTWYVAGG